MKRMMKRRKIIENNSLDDSSSNVVKLYGYQFMKISDKIEYEIYSRKNVKAMVFRRKIC